LSDKAIIGRVKFNFILLLVVILGSLLLSAGARAADTFPGPTLTGNSGSLVDSNVGTTGETGEPLTLGGGNLNTQWYSWVAPVTGFVSFGTCNPTGSSLTTFDTTIGVYTGTAVNALTQIGFNDDTPGCNSVVNANYGSTVAFNAIGGTTYRIQVDGYGNTTGQFNLFYGYSGFTTVLTGATATEGGGTGAFTVVLNAVPTGTATLTLGSSPQCTFSPNPLTFTSANWNVAQTVTVTAIDDAVVEGAHFCSPSAITPSGGGVVSSAAPPPTINVNDNDTATVSIANTTNGAEAGPVAGLMTLTQSAVSANNTVISYSVAGTATLGTDYTALTGTVTILAGSTTATISIPVINDAIVETNETVIVTLTAVTSGPNTSVGTPNAATNTIADNDAATVSIANTTNGSETGPTNGVMTLTQTAVSATNTVIAYSVSGTATPGADYTALSGTVTIPAGSTTATISFPVVNDVLVEGNETVIVTLTSVTSGLATLGAPLTATNTIADNDAPTVTIANTTNGNETGPVNGVMTVSLNAVSATNTVVAYAVSGTATSGADYTALTGTITIVAGSLSNTITIPVINDVIVEGNETVIVTLTSVTSGAVSLGATVVAINTIADNDSATVSIANTTNGTEAGPTNGVMTVTQTAVSATNTVIAYTVSGTATSGSDYTALSGTVTIPAGSNTATISIPVLDDAVLDPAETVIVTLTSITSGLPSLGSPLIATNTITDNEVATITLANTTDGSEAGPTNGVMTVTQSLISPTNTVIAYTVTGTATSGSDYTALSGTVTIPAGSTTATISIPIIDDAIVEGNETIILTLSSITSGFPILGTPVTATNTVADNDSATVTIANTTNGAESGPVSGVMTVTQTAVSATNTAIAYSVSGTATSGSDYTALSGTVIIPAGSTTATISIPVLDDAILDPAETVIVTLTSITSGLPSLGATLVATNTIADNESAAVTIANTTNGAEAGLVNGVMTVTQSLASPTNTVIAYSVSGTATSGGDYTALSGTVTIPAGSTTATILIPVIDDAILDPAETVIVTLTSISSGFPTLGATLTATNTITDNDIATVTIANTTDGAEAGPVNGVMTVTQTAISSTNTVISYSVSGTATSASDYTALTGTVTIPAGSTTATITIPVINDTIVEPSETVIITLTAITSGLPTLGSTLTATNTISDNDSATVSIANTTNGAEAGPVNGVMTVTQTAVSATNTIISYSVAGTATSGSDYTALTGSVTIPAGSTTATITIPVINDAIVEPSETVILTLTAVSSGLATLGSTLTATNTIADNDSATVSVANTTNGSEAGPVNGVMTVTQTAVSATNTVIAYTISGTATSGSDYTALSGTVTILAGSTTATITIPVINDATVEPSETVIITLSSISSGLATLGSTITATNTIADNDSATVSIVNTTNGAEAGPTNGVMTITQSAASATNTVIAFTVSGTATSGSDYSALSGTVTIIAGLTTATIAIPIINDLVVDPNETVIITLSSISSGLATLGTPLAATNTILDNDVASFTISKAVSANNITTPGTLTYTITIANTGNIPLTSPAITDTLSDGAALTLTSGPTLTSGDAAPLNSLDVSETWIYTATYAVTQAKINIGNTITNQATFATAQAPLVTSNIVSTTITRNPQLTILKTPSTSGPVGVGASIVYTFKVTNTGNVTMTNVLVTDTHNGSGPFVGPTNEVLTDNAPLGDSTDAGVNGTWDSLAPGDVVNFTANYTVTQNDVDYLQ
jgi:hypothetical protein